MGRKNEEFLGWWGLSKEFGQSWKDFLDDCRIINSLQPDYSKWHKKWGVYEGDLTNKESVG